MTGIVGPTITLALGFSLGVTAAFALVLLLASPRLSALSVSPSKIRAFKGEAKNASLALRAQDSRWMHLGLLSLHVPYGLAGDVRRLDPSSAELTLTPEYAGRFEGLSMVVNTTDALGLFLRKQEVQLGLVVESLPRALSAEARPITVLPLLAGDIPAGRSGGGQELYAVEEYQPNLDARDILWKRAARSADASIPVRVREANIKKFVSIGVAVGSDSEEELAKRTDLASEAIAQIGKILLLAGVEPDVSILNGGRLLRVRASTLSDLADATVGAGVVADGGDLPSLVSGSDLIIVGPKELGLRGGGLDGSKPTVLVSERPDHAKALRTAFMFTGREDLTTVAVQALLR